MKTLAAVGSLVSLCFARVDLIPRLFSYWKPERRLGRERKCVWAGASEGRKTEDYICNGKNQQKLQLQV